MDGKEVVVIEELGKWSDAWGRICDVNNMCPHQPRGSIEKSGLRERERSGLLARDCRAMETN